MSARSYHARTIVVVIEKDQQLRAWLYNSFSQHST